MQIMSSLCAYYRPNVCVPGFQKIEEEERIFFVQTILPGRRLYLCPNNIFILGSL